MDYFRLACGVVFACSLIYWIWLIISTCEKVASMHALLTQDMEAAMAEADDLEETLEYALKLGVRHPRPSQDNDYRAHVRDEIELRRLRAAERQGGENGSGRDHESS